MQANPDPSFMPVAERRCAECLFSSAKIVDEPRKADVLAECERTGVAFVCHKFTAAGEYGVCRAFFDEERSLVVVLARKFGAFRLVPLPAAR